MSENPPFFFTPILKDDRPSNFCGDSQTSFLTHQTENSHVVWENGYTELPNEGIYDLYEEFTNSNIIRTPSIDSAAENEYSENFINSFRFTTQEETTSQDPRDLLLELTCQSIYFLQK